MASISKCRTTRACAAANACHLRVNSLLKTLQRVIPSRSPEEKQEIAELAAELAKLGRIDNLDMTGSTWGLVFTESTASSAGKVGPFIGRTEQVIPESSAAPALCPYNLGGLCSHRQAIKLPASVRICMLDVQEFPSDQPGKYVNKLYLGPVTASLLADYKQTTRERIDVSFVNLSVTAGPFKWTKVGEKQSSSLAPVAFIGLG